MEVKNLTVLARDIYEDNKLKGFYDRPVETGTQLMMVTSELSEALEADRNGLQANVVAFEEELKAGVEFPKAFKAHIKDSYEDEIADAIIRLFSICGVRGIDIHFHIANKLKYNRSRERMHGGKAY